jgi:hypothetical protein
MSPHGMLHRIKTPARAVAKTERAVAKTARRLASRCSGDNLWTPGAYWLEPCEANDMSGEASDMTGRRV